MGYLLLNTMLYLSMLVAGDLPAPAPTPQMVLPGKVVYIVDGDTLDVEVHIVVRIRLLDCWAPEMRDSGGKESKEHLEEIATNKKCVVQIPLHQDLRKSFTFGRILGRVWAGGVDVSKSQVRNGYAKEDK